ncbi:MAG: long-chain fatty acid--CoA ligase, partial [Acidimicrobiales bacterium]
MAPLSLADATAQLTAPGQPFEITTTLVHGVETRVWRHAPATLRQVLDLSLGHGARDFLVYEGRRLTFEEHYRAASTFARRLVDVGVGHGDRVVIAARNLPEWVIAFWGVVSIGAIAVPLNAWWSTDELAYGVSDSGSTVAVVDEERLERLRPSFDTLDFLSHVIVVSDDPARPAELGAPHGRVSTTGFAEFLGAVAPDATPPDASIDADDDATIFYTSGTTGRPKGAVGSHRNAIANMMNLFFGATRSTLRFGASDDSGPGSFLLSIPLFHATGCLAVMIVSAAAGNKIIMSRRFDATQALEIIERERVTAFGGVPTVVVQVLDHPDFARFDTSSVNSVSYGGAPPPPDLARRIRDAFPRALPGNGYGLTETSASIAGNQGTDYLERPTSCGPVTPVSEAAIVPEDFEGDEPPADRPRGPDVVGELWLKGPGVVRGYWNRPDATAASFTRGWL